MEDHESDDTDEGVGPEVRCCAGCGEPLPRAMCATGRPALYHNDACRRLVVTQRNKAAAVGQAKAQTSTMPRGIDPATCEREYSEDEAQFLKAVDRYRRERRRPHPTACELLAIAVSLGYRKVAEPTT